MKNRPAALAFILVTLLIDVMGLGLIIPVFPNLLKQLSGSEVAGAQMLGIFTAIYAVMQFIFAPILGALSDRYGRRPVLLLSLLGVGLDYLFMYFAPNLGWLLLGRIIAGITGASITVANAYVADVTKPEDRARNFGLLGATFGVGFILGPALGGLLGNIDLRLPFAFAAGLSLLNAAYGYFVLPESVTDELRGRKLGREVFNPLAPLRDLGRYPLVRNLAGSFVLIGLAQQVIFSTWVLFTERTLGWSPAQNGIALAVVGVLSAITQAGLVARPCACSANAARSSPACCSAPCSTSCSARPAAAPCCTAPLSSAAWRAFPARPSRASSAAPSTTANRAASRAPSPA